MRDKTAPTADVLMSSCPALRAKRGVAAVRFLHLITAKISSRPVETVLLLFAPALWLAPAWTSLWLDEGMTYWVIKDGPAETIRRTLEYQGQSPLYFLLEWLTITLGGASEFVLRIPSLVAVGLLTWMIYRLGRRLIDEETGLTAAVFSAYWIFVVSDLPYNARPYALAVLAVAASTLGLLRWLESRRSRDQLTYVCLAALVIYLQPVFAGLFGIHLLAVLEYRRRGETRVTIAQFCCTVAGAVVLCLPLVPQVMSVGRLYRAMSSPTVSTGFGEWLVWYGAILGLLVIASRRLTARPPLFLYAWCVAPSIWFSLVTLTSGDTGSTARYVYWEFPAIVLAIGMTLRVLRRPIRLAVLAAVAILGFGQINRPALEDWRAATALARPLVESSDTPVLVRSGLPQARLVRFLEDQEAAQLVMAPLAFYHMPGALHALPHDLDEGYLSRVIVPSIESRPRIVIVAHDFDFQLWRRLPFQAWFDGHLPMHRSREIARLGKLVILVYDRVGAEGRL